MGWGRTLLLGDIGNQLDIQDQASQLEEMRRKARREARRDASTIESLQEQIDELEVENGELRLYMAAIIRLLVNKQVLSREQLQKVVDMIDLSDGSSDGKFDGKMM